LGLCERSSLASLVAATSVIASSCARAQLNVRQQHLPVT
jgi:hypothetical protein